MTTRFPRIVVAMLCGLLAVAASPALVVEPDGLLIGPRADRKGGEDYLVGLAGVNSSPQLPLFFSVLSQPK